MNKKNELVQKALTLGLSSYNNADFPQATLLLKKVLQLDPENFYALHFLGIILLREQNFKVAQLLLAKAVKIKPKDGEVNHHLGLAYKGLGESELASRFFANAVNYKPDLAVAYLGYADVVSDLGRYEEAIEAYHKALENDNSLIKAYNNLGTIYRKKADILSAISSYKSALQLDPTRLDIHSNLLMSMASIEAVSTEDYLVEAKRYGLQAKQGVTTYTDWPLLNQSENKLLNVGFVSGDLRNHPVAAFIESFIGLFDESNVTLTAFSTTPRVDVESERLKGYFKTWHHIDQMSDKQAADLIYQEKVDILIDLSGHTAGNRLPVFAWKPAPIQISWIGYFASTGLAEMDYILPTNELSPPEYAAHYVEKQWAIKSTGSLSILDVEAEVDGLPAFRNDYVTFGSFHSLAKISDDVIQVWCEILLAVPNSKIYLKCKELFDEQLQLLIKEKFVAKGIDEHRLIIEAASPLNEYFKAYNHVDIGLDPFPYNSGTVGYHSLWMGVPYIALKGDRMLSRIGYSNLSQVGLSNLAANDIKQYVEIAVELASDLPHLEKIRLGLRDKALSSGLFDGSKIINDLQTAFRNMWKLYLRKSLE